MINQLTPKVAMVVLIAACYVGAELESEEPVSSLSLAMSLALYCEPLSFQSYVVCSNPHPLDEGI